MRKIVVVTILLAAVALPCSAQVPVAAPTEVALHVSGGRLIVPLHAPDGTSFQFLLSTGNPATTFSRSGRARLKDVGALSLGGVSVPVAGSGTTSDSDLTVEGKVLDGILGVSVLSDFDVLIDAPGDRLVLKPVGRAVSWEGMRMSDPVRLRVYHGVILGLDVELNGRPYQAMLDLGTPALVVNEGVEVALGLAAEGVGTVRLGTTTFSDIRLLVRDLEVFKMWDPDGAGFVIVGAPIAYDCAISLSWVHREMRTCVR